MKKILFNIYIMSLLLIIFLPSCKKMIDDAFTNPNAKVVQPIESLLPGIISNMGIQHSANGSLYGPQNDGMYIGRFIQNWATSTTGNQYDQMGDNFINSSDIMGSIWAMFYYGQGENLNKVIKWGTEQGKWDYVGVAQAIRAWGWLTLTDVYGEVILKEAFRPDQLVFKYDTQEDVYAEIKNISALALENLSKTGDSVSQTNLAKGDQFMNGGDVEKWKKFVYGLLARTYNRTTNKSNYMPDSVIYYCDKAMQTNADNTSLKWSNAGGAGTYSYWSPFRGNIGTLRQSKFIADLMQGVNTAFPTASIDPRAWYIIRENPNGTFKGIRPNKGSDLLTVVNDRPANFWGGSYATTSAPSSDANARYIFKNSPIFPIMTASEIQFIKAEALYRKGDKPGALEAYKKGLLLNFDQLRSDYEVSVPAANKITDATQTAFMNNPIIVPSATDLNLSYIMMQKYISLYGWGLVETWVDLRRYHYTDTEASTGLQVYRNFNPPTGTDLYSRNNNKWIYRHRPRYNSEYLYNVAELNRIGAMDQDYITKEQWFSQP